MNTENIITKSPKTELDKTLSRQKVLSILWKVLIYTFLTVMAFVMILPFYWMFITALKTSAEINESLTPTIFPRVIVWRNFVDAFNSGSNNLTMVSYLKNTVIVAIVSTLFGTLSSILVAYALARLQFKGQNAIFTILLATMMIPGEMMVITNFITVSQFGWYGSAGIENYYSMIFPFLVSIFHIYLLRQTFKQVPNELYYAAKVDGTSDWKYLWKVMIPMAKSSIITIVILKVMGSWNAYVWPNLVAHEDYKMITSWLRGSFIDPITGRSAVNYQMAATIMVTIPLLLVFIFFRKYIMRGVSRSGIKG